MEEVNKHGHTAMESKLLMDEEDMKVYKKLRELEYAENEIASLLDMSLGGLRKKVIRAGLKEEGVRAPLMRIKSSSITGEVPERLTEKEIKEILDMYIEKRPLIEISYVYNLTKTELCNVIAHYTHSNIKLNKRDTFRYFDIAEYVRLRTEGKTQEEICVIMDIPFSTFYRKMQENGLYARAYCKYKPEEIYELFDAGNSVADISQHLQLSESTIYRYLGQRNN
jgi:hypothetical protein